MGSDLNLNINLLNHNNLNFENIKYFKDMIGVCITTMSNNSNFFF